MFSLETNDKKFAFFRPRAKKRAFFILYFGTFLQADFFCFIAFAFSKVKPQYSSVFAFLYVLRSVKSNYPRQLIILFIVFYAYLFV